MDLNPPTSPPRADQIEVILFGPGFGECILIHIGNNRWIIVDSCINLETEEPCALTYLKKLGLNPKDVVGLVVASHWHDDHIRGLSKILLECTSAEFCLSSALGKSEFIAFARKYDDDRLKEVRSGAREISRIVDILAGQGQNPPRTAKLALADRPIYLWPSKDNGLGDDCEVFSLSPSDKQLAKFLEELAALIPSENKTKTTVAPTKQNHVAVVIWVKIGDFSVLLGADLENSPSDVNLGWSAILASNTRPSGKATIFKVPHHGSKNAHHPAVWEQMLLKNPIAILSPFNRGTKLPRAEDVHQIKQYTFSAFSSATLKDSPTKIRRSPEVEKTIREHGAKIKKIGGPGAIRLRSSGGGKYLYWEVDLLPPAHQL